MIQDNAKVVLEISENGSIILSRNCKAERAVAMLTSAAGGIMGEYAPMADDEQMFRWAAKYGAALGRSMTRIMTDRINERLEMQERDSYDA